MLTPILAIGTRTYYFRSIFHDWPDHKCRQVLQNTVAAMTHGCSKLLLNENGSARRGRAASSGLAGYQHDGFTVWHGVYRDVVEGIALFGGAQCCQVLDHRCRS